MLKVESLKFKDMKTKRIFSIIAAAALTISVSAQQSDHENYVGVSMGGGLNTMLYKPVNGQQQLGYGFDAALFYGHFFNQWIGLGFGLNYTWANAYATYNWNEVTPGLVHASNPNVTYNLTTGFQNYKERQNVGVLSIPVELLFRKVFNPRWALIGGVGLSVDFPIHGAYTAKGGSYSTTGVFPDLGDYVVSNMPEHGFSTYTTAQNAKFNNRAKVGGSVLADLGARVAINDNWGFYFGVYFGYGFTNLLATAKTEEMIMINTANPAVIDYRGTFDSNETAKANLIRCGLKIAFDFGAPSPAKKKAEAERIAREAFVADSIAAAALAAANAEAKAKADSLAAAEQARLAAQADSIAAAKAQAMVEADSIALANAKARAIADSIAAAEAEHARLVQEAIERFNALKAKGEAITVHFDTGGDKLKFKDGEQEMMDEVCMVLSERHDIRVVVIGHTDNTGNAEQNLKVWGKKRAEALKAYMVSRGVNDDQIKCESKGQEEPVADNATREGRAQNRRANIKFL